MLVELKEELTQAAADTSLPTKRRELAIELLDFIDTAAYTFDSDCAPEVKQWMAEARTVVEVRSKWHVPTTSSYAVPVSVPVAVETEEFEDIF